jgi:hypothetical protein
VTVAGYRFRDDAADTRPPDREGPYRIAKRPDVEPPAAAESFWMTHNMTSAAPITDVKKNRPSISKFLRSLCHLVCQGQVSVKA